MMTKRAHQGGGMYNPNDDAAAAEAFVAEQASKAELADLCNVDTGADIAAEGEAGDAGAAEDDDYDGDEVDDADVTQLMPDDDNEV